MQKKMLFVMLIITAFVVFSPILMAEGTAAAKGEVVPLKDSNPIVAKWAIIMAGLAMTIASSFGAFAQSIAIKTACDGIARNPGAAKDIRGALIIGLVLIESLVLYTLVVVFVKYIL